MELGLKREKMVSVHIVELDVKYTKALSYNFGKGICCFSQIARQNLYRDWLKHCSSVLLETFLGCYFIISINMYTLPNTELQIPYKPHYTGQVKYTYIAGKTCQHLQLAFCAHLSTFS